VPSKTSQPRQQHFIPRFYLEGFCDPLLLKRDGKNVLWVYEQSKSIRRSAPQKEARVRDFYTLTSATGERDLRYEEWLSGVEENAARVIRNPIPPFTEEDRGWLALFVGTLFTRTPLGREINDTRVGPAVDRFITTAAQDPDRFVKFISDLKPDEMQGIDPEEVRLRILEGRAEELCQTLEHKLACVAYVGAMCGEELLKKDWQVVFANEEEFFLTSDSPVVPVAWESHDKAYFNAGFAPEGSDIYFPLTREACLHMRKGITPGTYVIRDRGVRYINNLIMKGAHKRIYAAERSNLIQTAFEKNGCQFPAQSFQPRWDGNTI
jgi:hypothetical protein